MKGVTVTVHNSTLVVEIPSTGNINKLLDHIVNLIKDIKEAFNELGFFVETHMKPNRRDGVEIDFIVRRFGDSGFTVEQIIKSQVIAWRLKGGA